MILTVLLAVVLLILVVVGLSIGYILTGSSRLKAGCGLTPGRKKENSSCSICGEQRNCEEGNKDDYRGDTY